MTTSLLLESVHTMTTLGQSKPSRKQQLLKVRSYGLEAERKKPFTLARPLDVQEKRQPQPFLNTAFGKLLSELRVIIYQHLVVTPRSQTDSDLTKENAGRPSAASQRFIHFRDSSLSVLRTCRQMKLEAHGIFHASGIPYFTNVRERFRFLTSHGPVGRLQLQAFPIGDLMSSDAEADEYGMVYNFMANASPILTPRYWKSDPVNH